MITQERLKELFRYNPETGEFLRIKGVKKGAAGTIAGTLALNGYVTISVDCKRYYAHRLAWLYTYGELPVQIDHKDRDRANNALENLRAADNSTNGANKSKPSGSKQRFKGVRKLKHANRWSARIKHGTVELHIGTYATEEDAARAYNKKAMSLFGEFAELNDLTPP
jgi:hypothetical protein